MKELTTLNLINLNDKQMEHIINLLYMYKKMHPEKDVYFNENQIKSCIELFKNFN